MRILGVNSAGFVEGGVEAGLVVETRVLREEGHDVRLLAGDYGSKTDRFNDYEFTTRKSKFGLLADRLWNKNARHVLEELLHDFNPDLVVVHTLTGPTPSALRALRGTPTVLVVHGPEWYLRRNVLWALADTDFRNHSSERKLRDLSPTGLAKLVFVLGLWRPLARREIRYVDRLLALSQDIREMLESEGHDVDYLPMGVSLPPLATRDSIPGRLLYVGRLEAAKGVDVAIDALAAIAADRPHLELHIAGDGSQRRELEARAAAAGIGDRVHFLGRVDRARLISEYHQAWTVLIPSVWPEPFGKVGVEALACGRPVIATEVGGVGDWFQPEINGVATVPGDPIGLAEAIKRLDGDDALWFRLSANARPSVARFDYDVHIGRLLALYRSVARQSA